MSTTEHEPYDDGTTQVKLTLSEDSGSSAGTVLEELRLDQLVDQGLSGEIYRATNLLAGKACAVKLFRPNLEIGRVAWGRYTHRAEQISRLELPNVARFFGHGRTPDGQYYAVFDWVDGQSLRSLLEQHGKLSQRSYLAVLTGIANALATVHEAGFAHLALHPGNVMIRSEADGSTDVQLLDFGVAAVHPAYGEATEVPRRPEDALHIAPEVLKGLKGDSRSDVYALAVLLYRAVTGDVPFVGDDFETIVEKVQNEGPRLPKSVAAVRPELEAVILRGLVKDPQKRTPSVQALLSALDPIAATTGRHRALSRVSTQEQLLVSDPSQSEPATAPTALKVPKKRMWMLLGLVVAVLLFGGALAWTLLGGEEEVKTTPRPRPKRVAKRVTRTTPRAARPAPIPKRKAAPKPPVRTVQRKGASAPKEQAAPAAPAPRPKVLARPMGSRARALRRVAARLTQAYGTVKVLTGHPRAKILFDGKVVGQGKLHTLRRVPTGKHTLQAEIDGQKGRTKTIDVKAGATLDVTL